MALVHVDSNHVTVSGTLVSLNTAWVVRKLHKRYAIVILAWPPALYSNNVIISLLSGEFCGRCMIKLLIAIHMHACQGCI